MKKPILISALVLVILIILSQVYVHLTAVDEPETKTIQLPTPTSSLVVPTTPAGARSMQINPDTRYQALIKTTAGTMTVDLSASSTPITVNNFVTLARSGFYENTIFHRVIKGFMIQGGDPEGTGRGGPGYVFADEPFTGEYTRGTLAMANSGPNTNGSQFFIMHEGKPLPKNYVIFGRLVGGYDVLDTIATASTSANLKVPGENSVPINPVRITSIEIIEQ